MGIPRLTKDVAPYAQTCILGQHSADASSVNVTRLVIDGPSLIYHIYNALSRNRIKVATDQFWLSFGYGQINECLAQFLRDVTNSGVQIHALVFDGALPVSKQPTRVERLEETRKNLENHRKLQSYDNSSGLASLSRDHTRPQGLQNSDYQAFLWDDTHVAVAKQSLLPPPPFMVPSAIEFLQSSEWSGITHVVPGEADGFCASEAASSASAVLSNDSDLLMYDLGSRGAVVMLRTLDAVDFPLKNRPGSIKGQCYHTSELMTFLNVPSMLSFGFHRSVDSSSSTSFIAQRARDSTLSDENASWASFKQEYETSNLQLSAASKGQEGVRTSIQKLDPRLSEVFVRLENFEDPHSYLPVVLEDPMRDSAWSYGFSIRQLAYSILLQFGITTSTSRRDHIIEFARKGTRIADQHIEMLSQPLLHERIQQIIDTYDYYSSATGPGAASAKLRHSLHSSQQANIPKESKIVFSYYLMAAEIVIAQRLSNSKFYMTEFSHLFPHNNSVSPASSTTSWEDIHFHACIHCTLYSFRMLKQVIDVVKDSTVVSHPIPNTLQTLSTKLTSMPAIADLFLDVTALRSMVLQLDSGEVANKIRRLLQRVDPAYLKSLDQKDKRSSKTSDPNLNSKSRVEDEPQWTEVSSKSKSKKRTIVASTPESSGRSSKARTNQQRVDRPQFNAFALLQGHSDSD